MNISPVFYEIFFTIMASGILHNLRNTFAPMTGQVGIVCDELEKAPVDNVRQATKELESDGLEGERRPLLYRYMQLSSMDLTDVIQDTKDKLKRVLEGASLIEEILAEQDKHSHSQKVLQSLQLEKILQETCALMSPQIQESALIEIDPVFNKLPPVRAERVSLIQVFSNLLQNAAQSISKTARRIPGRYTAM